MFTWDEPARPFARGSERRQQMYRRELEDRAALLMRLGHTQAHVKARLKQNVAWDFELHARPAHAGEVDRIVDAVYKRNQR